jgi:hypothetical protein
MLRGKVTNLEKPQSRLSAFMGYEQHYICKQLDNWIFIDKLEWKCKFSYLGKHVEQNETAEIMW